MTKEEKRRRRSDGGTGLSAPVASGPLYDPAGGREIRTMPRAGGTPPAAQTLPRRAQTDPAAPAAPRTPNSDPQRPAGTAPTVSPASAGRAAQAPARQQAPALSAARPAEEPARTPAQPKPETAAGASRSYGAPAPYGVPMPEMPDSYGAAYREALRRYEDYAPFSYDLRADPAYQAYKKEYVREGRRAADDALGRMAAMTGGVPSTAAVTAAQQANDYYNAKLADRVPELYELAYAMYTGEQDRLYRTLSALRGARSDELSRYETALGQWNADRSRADTLDREAWERAYKEKAYDDSRADAAWEQAYKERAYDDSRADAAWEQAYKEKAYGDSRADAAWDQAYREKAYADDRADSERDWSYRLGEIGQKVYAYGDGEPYEIGSGRGLSFLSAAAPGQIMTGGDGSVWVKNADGSTVITRGGETWTVPAPASAGSRGSGGSGRSASSAKPDLTAAQVLSALNAGVRTQKVLDAYEYWYGEPYAEPGGADTERETAADPSMLPRFSLPGLSDRFGGSLDAGPQNTGLTTAAYNMAGRGIIELWDKGDDANRQKARDQLAAVWPSLSEEQKRNMRSVLGLHGMEISA